MNDPVPVQTEEKSSVKRYNDALAEQLNSLHTRHEELTSISASRDGRLAVLKFIGYLFIAGLMLAAFIAGRIYG